MAKQPKPFALGERVTFSSVLKRQRVDTAVHNVRFQLHWLPVEKRGEGLVVGYRTLVNGYTVYDRHDGNQWVPVSTVKCVLVAFNLYRLPACVPLDAISRASGTGEQSV